MLADQVSGASISTGNNDGWSSGHQGGADVLRMDDHMPRNASNKFDDLLMSVSPGETFAPVLVPEEVIVDMKREEVGSQWVRL